MNGPLDGAENPMGGSDAVLEQNRRAWDRLVRQGSRFTRVADEEAFANPLQSVDSAGWLGGSIAGWKVLCLAAGGGRQGPLYAAAGAQVTVVDLSEEMLRLDRQVAQQRGLKMRILQASMDRLEGLQESEFDLVIHPVSTCYVPDIGRVFAEVARVLRGDGIYVSQHKSPTSLQLSRRPADGAYVLEHRYYDKTPLKPSDPDSSFREPGTLEYVHRLEEIVGGMCRAGFRIEDLVEPFHASQDGPIGGFGDRCSMVAPYLRIKARRSGGMQTPRLIV